MNELEALSEISVDLNSKLIDLEKTTISLNTLVDDLRKSPVKVDITNEKWLNYTAQQQKKVYEQTTEDIKKNNVQMLEHVNQSTNAMMTKIDDMIKQQQRLSAFKMIGVFTFQILSMALFLLIFFNVLTHGIWQGLGLHALWQHGEWWTYGLAILFLVAIFSVIIWAIIVGAHKIHEYFEYR